MLATSSFERRTLSASVFLHLALFGLLLSWQGFSPATRQWVEVDLLAPRGQSEAVSPVAPIRPQRQTKAPNSVRPQTSVASDTAPVSKAAEFMNETGQSQSELGRRDGIEATARDRYLYELRNALERSKVYPAMAKRLGQQGRVMVKFLVDSSGRVTSAEVIEASRFPLLNEAAQKLVVNLSGLKPIPQEVGKSKWEFVLPVDYQL